MLIRSAVHLRIPRFAALLCAAGLTGFGAGPARAEFLFNSFLTPSFSTKYSAWDVFYTPYGYGNYPDYAAPYGTYGPAPAGYTIPPNANPSNPYAYWDTRNATITQTGTSSAFIIGPGVSGSGNIYSFAAPTSYVLNDPNQMALGTVCFQFQTDGTLLNFSSIKLQYTNASGTAVSLAPDDLLREYRTSGSSFGGITNRSAVQWNLTGLGVTSYQLVFSAASSSNSFQLASIDTAATYGAIIPAKRNWTAGGSGLWGNGANWQEGSTSNENGNVRFVNTAAATPVLDANHTVGELRFDTPAAVTINSPGGYALTANTGLTTTAAATGTYTINSSYRFGAFNILDVEAGSVQMNGVVSGAYGFEKDGAGSLTLSGNNTFTGAVTVGGGTLRLSGTNAYTGSTSVVQGTLIVGADALAGVNGPLGNTSSNIALGADSTTFQFVGGSSASLVIDGNHTVARNVDLANGTYGKTLAAINASAAGATYAGTVNFNTSAGNVHLTTTAATDKLTFSGAMSGGATSGSVAVDGAGTVVFSGQAKTYANATNVNGGMLLVAAGSAYTGSGAVAVNNGSRLVVDGTLGGSGTLSLNVGVLGGSGTVSRMFTVAAGGVLSPGNGVGTLNTVGETWAAGGTYQWEINSTAANSSGVSPGQDLANISGSLSLTANASNRFTLQLRTLNLAGTAGLLAGFDPASNYSWRLAATSGGITGFDPSDFTVDRSGFANAAPGVFSIGQVGNDLYLNYAAVPEPTTWYMTGAGLAAMMFARRKRTRKIIGGVERPSN